jgi:hypothetical protein
MHTDLIHLQAIALSALFDYQGSRRSAIGPLITSWFRGNSRGTARSWCLMLIDKSHKRWAIISLAIGAIATVVYAWASGRDANGARGGSATGLWFGILAAGLMIFTMLLSGLRKVPSWWWIGPRKSWLRGHIWLGALSGWMCLYHSGFHWGGPLERGLWAVLALTLASGVAGLVLQQFLPRLITARIPAESPAEQIPHLCSVLRRRADSLIDEICRQIEADPRAALAVEKNEATAGLRRYYEEQVRPFLSEPYRRSFALAAPAGAQVLVATVRGVSRADGVQAPASELGELCEVRRQLGEQQRLHRWLHGWLLIHVPLSWVLLVLVLVHALWSLYY